MAENISTQGYVQQTAGLRGNRSQDAELITYQRLQNYPQSRNYEVQKSDVFHGNGRDSGLSSEILSGENTRPSTSYLRNYGRQNTPFNTDFLQQDSNVFVKNGILSANNEHLLQQIKDLEQDKLLARIEKQNSENRIMKLEKDFSVMSRNYKRTIDNLNDQKNIEILKVQTRCKEENEQKIEDLRQRKEAELAFEKNERSKEQIKYQNLFISKEALQNHYEEAVKREQETKELLNQREAKHKEEIEFKNKQLGDAKEEILNLKHQSELVVKDHKATLNEMEQKHGRENDAQKHKYELLQKECENLKGRLDDLTVKPTRSQICTIS